ncbi:ankyrin repeat-containing domain protein [Cladorrhinum samala]|uniref:Ankyrin repeat-containing domain protein n=1 Tax=Cladorrhinum samala TaxID=585594 RepID=A0AAV9HV13_9PEZI|nr:ankyrin repeat-containing domain protein [Cladorrhinum samala]
MSGLEILGVVASIGALVEMADRAYKVVFKYLPAAKNARKDVQRLITEIRTLCGVLHSLRLFASSLENDNELGSNPGALRIHHVESCYYTLSKIRSDLEEFEADFNSQNKLKSFRRSLRWPFTEEETTKLLERIAAEKQTMDLAMTVDSTTALLRKLSRYHNDTDRQMADIQSDVRTIIESTRRVAINAGRQEVLGFFNRYEAQASEYLEASVSSRFPLTGLWFTHGQQFKDWLSTPRSRLWLGGIPGAGKTVLAGAMIEEALSLCTPKCAVAFFFCDTSKGTIISLTDLLGVLSTQLARQNDDAFHILQQYHAQLCPEQGIRRAITLEALKRVLANMIGCFDRVYIFVDGLDEYGTEAEQIIISLTEIWESTATLSIALLSRDEQFIRDLLEENFDYIPVLAHKEDIEAYVIAKIQERFGSKQKRKMADTTKDAITKALVERSDGMFRWVACMVDFMCEFSTDRDRLDALKDLPPDLGKTYQRILDRVNESPKNFQTLVQRVLRLIDFRGAPITIGQIREAVSPHISSPEDLIPEDEITRRCSSLIRKSNDGLRFEFAHFTVREFLRSDDLLGTPYEKYHMSDAKISINLVSTSIRFLLRPEFSHDDMHGDLEVSYAKLRAQDDHPFFSYAARALIRTQDNSWREDPQVQQLLIELFQWPKTGNFIRWAVEVIEEFADADVELIIGVMRADFTPLHFASLLAIPWLTQHLLSRGLQMNSISLLGTPLHCAVGGFHVCNVSGKYLHSFMFHPPGDEHSKSEDMVTAARHSTVKILLGAGANHSQVCQISKLSRSPLYFALYRGDNFLDFSLFIELLQAGASIDEDSYKYALNMFNFFRELLEDSGADTSYEDVTASLNIALKGILEFTASRPPNLDKSAALRNATLELISDSTIKFNLGASMTEVLSRQGSNLPGNAQQTLQPAKLAIKYGDVEGLRRILDSSVVNLANEKLKDGTTLLHYAVERSEMEAFSFLVSRGFDVNVVDDNGNTALMICNDDVHTPMLRELLRCGGRTDIVKGSEGTIWHMAARNDRVQILEVLTLESTEDKFRELSRQDKNGCTPAAVAILSGSVQSALYLLRHSENEPACFASASHRPLYREAVRSSTSIELLQAMVDFHVPLDPVEEDGDTPLHYLQLGHSAEYVCFLKKLYPNAGRRNKDNRTPLEQLLSQLFTHSTWAVGAWETIKALLREVQSLVEDDGTMPETTQLTREMGQATKASKQTDKADAVAVSTRSAAPEKTEQAHDEVRRLWSRLGTIFPDQELLLCYQHRILSDQTCSMCLGHFNALSDFLFQKGALEEFETQNKSSGLIELIDCFHLVDGKWPGAIIRHAEPLLSRVIKETRYWESAKTHPLVLGFLGKAVFFYCPSIVELLCARDIDVHAKVEGVSALGRACLSASSCTPTLFETVLGSADPAKLNETNHGTISGTTFGLIHLLAWENNSTRTAKLKILLQARVDVNLRISTGTPAMVLYLRRNFTEGARILLEAGADPNLQDNDGWDSLLAAVEMNNISFLEQVKLKVDPNIINWQHVCNPKDASGEVAYSRCNALHIAALFFAGNLECLKFYLEGRYVDEMSPRTADGFSYLHIAASMGNEGAVKLLGHHCTAAETINSRSHARGILPLNSGVFGGNADVIRALLDLGADKTKIGLDGHTPSLHALRVGKHEIAKLLDDSQRAEPQDDKMARKQQINIMRKALEDSINGSSLTACQALLDMGCPFNQPLLGCGACSPLLYALTQGQGQIVVWMTEKMNGYDLNILEGLCWRFGNWSHTSPAVFAAGTIADITTLSSVLTKYLEAGGLPFLEPRTPFHAAVLGKNLCGIRGTVQHIKANLGLYRTTHSTLLDGRATIADVVKAFINAKSHYEGSRGRTPLHLAVLENSIETVIELLNHQADPNQQDVELKSPLHLAVSNNCGSVEATEKIVKALLKAGARLELQDCEFRTPLLEATLQCKVGIVRLLLAHGADAHAQDKDGLSALWYSVNDPSLFLLFLEHGLDPLLPGLWQVTPACYALLNQRSRTLILNRLDIRDIPPLTSDALNWLPCVQFLKLFAHLKLINKRQAHLGRPSIVELHPDSGKSPLHLACEYGHVEAVDSLLRVGARVDFQDSDGRTPLFAACSRGRLEVVKVLVDKGASVAYKDLKADTARSALAAAAKFPEIVEWLLVGRFSSHRRKLGYHSTIPGSGDKEHPEIRPWSGLWAAQLHLSRADRDWLPGRDFADFANRNYRLREELAGHVVSGIKLLWPANDLDSFERSHFSLRG